MRLRWKQAALLAGIFSLFVVIAYITMVMGYRNLTDTALLERRYITQMASEILQSQLNSLQNIATYTSERKDLIDAVEKGDWKEASELLKDIPDNFPTIDRVFLSDLAGIQHAAFPWDDSVIGKDFSYRDWYKGVVATWQPYVSEAYRRAAKPAYNVVAVSVPIRKDTGSVIGILVLQIRLERFFEWIKDIDVGKGRLFFVDQNENVAGHPFAASTGSILTFHPEPGTAFSTDTTRQRSTLTKDPLTDKEVVILGTHVEPFGWTAYYAEDPVSMFEARRQAMIFMIQLYVLGALIILLAGLHLNRTIGKLERTETFLESIVENIPNMIFVKDAATLSFLRFNRAGEALLGQKRTDLLGKNDYDFFPKEQAEFFIAKDRKVLTSGTTEDIPEEPIETPAGRKYLHTKKVPITGKDGKPLYLLGISEDITGKKLLEKAKSEFVTVASHQLRTPLANIRWTTELLLDSMKKHSGTQKQLTLDIHEAVMRLSDITQAMLTASRIEAHSIRESVAQIDLSKLARSIKNDFRHQTAKKRLKFNCTCPQHIAIRSDLAILKEVLVNIVSNAIRYTPSCGTISLCVREESDRILIEVRDNGIGIPADEQEKIFRKLFRASNAASLDVNGTGLGLYVARSLATLIGGTLIFSSEEGRGSTFTLSLPINPEKQ